MFLSSINKHEASPNDTYATPATFCKLCEKIDFTANINSLKKLEQYSPRKDATGCVLGSLTDILRKSITCKLCALVHFLVTEQFLEREIELEEGSEVSLEWKENHFKKRQVVSAVVRVRKAQWITLNEAFEPMRKLPGSDIKGIFPPPFRSNIDIKRTLELRHIEDQLKMCDAHHGASCQRNSSQAKVVPLFLIDTQNLCLVRSDTKSSYFTLSYVWGQTENAELTQANLDALLRPGALHEIWPKISRVVREAIHIVAKFDVYAQRYLWVDSLCILQDDPEHKHSQIAHMGTIYYQSAMTIVALSAINAGSTLLAHRGDDLWMQTALGEVERQKGVRLAPEYTMRTHLYTHVDRPDYTYRSRGWTFQEEKLSRRVLYCTESEMLFQCGMLLAKNHLWNDCKQVKLVTKETHMIVLWLSLVKEYSRRHFTYLSDTLRGFAGIADMLNHPVSGKRPLHVVCGICIEWFPYSLYWRPNDLTAQKRHSSFPTWSWASCVGAVYFPNASDIDLTRRSTAQLVRPPIPLEFRNNTVQPDGNGSSFDSQRSNIREYARAAIALDTDRRSTTLPFSNRPTASEVDTFFMLKMHVRSKVLNWSDLGLTVTIVSVPDSSFNTKADISSSYALYRQGSRVGYTDVSPKVFESSKEDIIFFIPLFEDRYPGFVFLVASCVGEDLYERLGVGWGYSPLVWHQKGSSDRVVYLI